MEKKQKTLIVIVVLLVIILSLKVKTTYRRKIDTINLSEGMPFLVNGSKGFKFKGEQQLTFLQGVVTIGDWNKHPMEKVEK